MRHLRFPIVALAAMALMLVGAASTQATAGIPYTFHGVDLAAGAEPGGLCTEGGTMTMNAKFVVHVNATQAGLTEQEILDLLDIEDPTGILRTITVTETGTVSTVETTGQRISGHFTTWFGGNVMTLEDFVFTSTFNLQGHDQDGNLVTAHGTAHVMFAGGVPVVDFDKARVRGCA
jgi:uncharacterized lipoprotein NlpE involved in copper resistance